MCVKMAYREVDAWMYGKGMKEMKEMLEMEKMEVWMRAGVAAVVEE